MSERTTRSAPHSPMNRYQQLEAIIDDLSTSQSACDKAWDELKRLCGKCESGRAAYERYDRHGIYSGKACDKCAKDLPGQGSMWDYEAEEPIEET